MSTDLMTAPIAPLVAQSDAVKAVLGANPVRFWEFGEAPRDESGTVQPDYAVWQTVYGTPPQYLGRRPDHDRWGVQVDVYAATPAKARAIAKALRDVIELQAYVVAWRGESRDVPTGLCRYSFTVEWLTDR